MDEEEDFGFTNDIYRTYFQMNFEWPCLSFDVIRDNLGAFRTNFPHTAYFVSGTQADMSDETIDENQLIVTKISNMQCTKYDDNNEEPNLEDAKVKVCANKVQGVINRVRSMPQSPNIVATWSDTGAVNIYDINVAILASNTDAQDTGSVDIINDFPDENNAEGYAIGWDPNNQGTLAYGDNDGEIYIVVSDGNEFSVFTKFLGHTKSIEDIVFSPQDAGIFASCSSDGTVRIWDMRDLTKPVIDFAAHQVDCNVIDWNQIQKNLLCSGADDGAISIWDIRALSVNASPEATIDYHTNPITSIEWDPNDESSFAASCEDGAVTIWDLSVEPEDPNQDREEGIPDQLMFEHNVEEPKEIHYCPQIPSMIAVTGINSFEVFIPDIEGGVNDPQEQ